MSLVELQKQLADAQDRVRELEAQAAVDASWFAGCAAEVAEVEACFSRAQTDAARRVADLVLREADLRDENSALRAENDDLKIRLMISRSWRRPGDGHTGG